MTLNVNDIQNMAQRIKENIQKVIIGKDKVIDLMLTSILCSGHVLLEDVPGLGKTMLAKSLAKSVDSSFNRIQFTPDLLPGDVTGINIYNQKTGEFQFKKGPLMNEIILADEINRATPRTQSSLLEAMEEHQVSVDGVTYKLDEPFFVVATQNPVETGGTFPLPEAQLDRFFMQLSMEYPNFDEEMQILLRFRENNPLEELKPVVNSADIIEARKNFTKVFVDEEIIKYLLKIVRSTREHEEIELGISPRGSMALFRAIQAYAAIQGRDYVLPDDVKELVNPIFIHRIILNGQAAVKGRKVDDVIKDILNGIATPVENLKAM